MIVTQKIAADAWRVMASYIPDALALAWPMPATEDEVRMMYRMAAKNSHPDTEGGSGAAFAAVDRAKHVLLQWLARAAPVADKPHGGVFECPRCHGARFVMLQKGFKRLRVQCPSCNGNGELYEKEKEGDRL